MNSKKDCYDFYATFFKNAGQQQAGQQQARQQAQQQSYAQQSAWGSAFGNVQERSNEEISAMLGFLNRSGFRVVYNQKTKNIEYKSHLIDGLTVPHPTKFVESTVIERIQSDNKQCIEKKTL